MNKLNSKIEELESSIKDLKSLMAKRRKFASGPNILLGCGTAISAVSIYTLPKWISVILVAFLSGYAIADKRKNNSLVASKLDEIHSVTNDINASISNLLLQIKEQKECGQKDENINGLKARIKELESLLDSKPAPQPTPVQDSFEKTLAELHLEVILKKIQELDIDVESFGEECTSFIRKEFKRTLRTCGLEFIDYSTENNSFFNSETAAINNIDCTARAIVTITNPKKVVLKGSVIIPEK